MRFTRTSDLVQRLQLARQALALEAAIARLDKYHRLILDDLAYVSRDQAETSVLIELISARYPRRSLPITANQPFGEWGKVFPDPAMTLAAVDRLVHHAIIFEMNVESYRRRAPSDGPQHGGHSARQPAPMRRCRRATIRPTHRTCQRQAEQIKMSTSQPISPIPIDAELSDSLSRYIGRFRPRISRFQAQVCWFAVSLQPSNR